MAVVDFQSYSTGYPVNSIWQKNSAFLRLLANVDRFPEREVKPALVGLVKYLDQILNLVIKGEPVGSETLSSWNAVYANRISSSNEEALLRLDENTRQEIIFESMDRIFRLGIKKPNEDSVLDSVNPALLELIKTYLSKMLFDFYVGDLTDHSTSLSTQELRDIKHRALNWQQNILGPDYLLDNILESDLPEPSKLYLFSRVNLKKLSDDVLAHKFYRFLFDMLDKYGRVSPDFFEEEEEEERLANQALHYIVDIFRANLVLLDPLRGERFIEKLVKTLANREKDTTEKFFVLSQVDCDFLNLDRVKTMEEELLRALQRTQDYFISASDQDFDLKKGPEPFFYFAAKFALKCLDRHAKHPDESQFAERLEGFIVETIKQALDRYGDLSKEFIVFLDEICTNPKMKCFVSEKIRDSLFVGISNIGHTYFHNDSLQFFYKILDKADFLRFINDRNCYEHYSGPLSINDFVENFDNNFSSYLLRPGLNADAFKLIFSWGLVILSPARMVDEIERLLYSKREISRENFDTLFDTLCLCGNAGLDFLLSEVNKKDFFTRLHPHSRYRITEAMFSVLETKESSYKNYDPSQSFRREVFDFRRTQAEVNAEHLEKVKEFLIRHQQNSRSQTPDLSISSCGQLFALSSHRDVILEDMQQELSLAKSNSPQQRHKVLRGYLQAMSYLAKMAS